MLHARVIQRASPRARVAWSALPLPVFGAADDMKSDTATSGRNDLIDAYRAMLILAVMAFHYLLRWTPTYEEGIDLTQLSFRYSWLIELGRYGVHGFFVISGLVIAMTVEKCKGAGEFAFRRFSRLYPAFIFAASLTFIFSTSFAPPPLQSNFRDYAFSLTLVPNIFKAHFVDGAYWSLAVEVKFYAWVAAFVLLLRGRYWIGLLAMAVMGVVLAQFHRFHGISVAWLISPFMPFFLIGMGAWSWIFSRQTLRACALAGTGAALYVVNWRTLDLAGRPSVLVALILGLAICGMIILLALWRSPRLGPLPYLGRISYALYLLHQNLGVTLIGRLKASAHLPDVAAVSIASVACVAVAAASFHLIEQPAQSWLRRAYLRQLPHRRVE